MKRKILICAAVLIFAVQLAACGSSQQNTAATEATVINSVTESGSTAPIPENNFVQESDDSAYYIELYAEQIARYGTALSEQWDMDRYFDNSLSALPYYYYEGNPLENVGFAFVDLDNNGIRELIIGAILNADQDPSVFEIWTVINDEPVMLVQGGSRNRYILQFLEDDNTWLITNEGSSSAANHATYDLMLNEGQLEVVRGIVFDAMADEQNPWFLSYDLDWDVSNDESIDEETAGAILEANRERYTALEYFPYSGYCG